jgi:hypothetical protein
MNIDFNAIVLILLATVYDAQVYNAPQMSKFIMDCSPAPWHKVSPHKFQPNPPFLRLDNVCCNISSKLCSEHLLFDNVMYLYD